MAKLQKLEAENIKGLKTLSIDFSQHGNLVVLGGKNGAGKSSGLDTVVYLFGGKGVIPDDVLRHGAKSGAIDGTLDDGTHVRRTFTEKGVHLVVENKDGMRFTSPQTVLDALIQSANGGKNTLLFDPLAFDGMGSKQQVETLKEAFGIDTSDIDEAARIAYDERRDLTRDRKQLKARVDAATVYDDAPEEEVSVADLVAERTRREKTNAGNYAQRLALETKRQAVRELKSNIETRRQEIDTIVSELEKHREALEACEKTLKGEVKAGQKEASRVETLEDNDLVEIDEQLGAADETNLKVRSNREASSLQTQLEALETRIDEAGARVTEAAVQKQAAIEGADFSIPGLELTEHGVVVNGVRYENLASGDRTEISVGMALAMNPELKVVLVHGGSLLDAEHRARIEQMAIERDTLILMEVVGAGSEVSIFLVNGQVAEKPAVEEEPIEVLGSELE